MIVVPLVVGGEVDRHAQRRPDGRARRRTSRPNEFDLTKLFAGQASIALQNAETHGAVTVRAEHDALTGLRNHGAFQRELGEPCDPAASGGPFAVLMMDLDAFKAFNDTRGHPAGDALLTGDRAGDERRDPRRRPRLPLRRRRVRGDPARRGPDRRPTRSPSGCAAPWRSCPARTAAGLDQRRRRLLPGRRPLEGRPRRRRRPVDVPRQADRARSPTARPSRRPVPARPSTRRPSR